MSVCGHPFPSILQVATSHLCFSVLWLPVQMAQVAVGFWQRNSECPHWLQLPQRVSTLSAINGMARNLLPATHISVSSFWATACWEL